MSIENAFLIGFGFLLGASIGLQIYLAYKIQKNKRETKQHPSKAVEERMSSKATFRFGLFHTIFYLYVIIWSLYNIWVGIFSVFLGIAIIIGGLILIRKPLQLFRENRPVHAEYSIALPLLPRLTNSVTPELIIEILNEQSINDAIKNDLKKTMQIGYKEPDPHKTGGHIAQHKLFQYSAQQHSDHPRNKRAHDSSLPRMELWSEFANRKL